MSTAQRALSGWGNFTVETCAVHRPSSWGALQECVAAGGTLISRGLGRSYGDSSLNEAGVIDQTGLSRFLDFDADAGVIECESGVSLGEIIEVVQPRGWFLPTTPGTKFVTVGGAIAADVHGKNHHADGSFGDFLEHFHLLLASGEIVRCSPTENPDLFGATIGGMGLTGLVLSARFRLHPVQTAYYDVTFRRTKDLDESLRTFADTDGDYRYSVAWIDCLAKGRSLGRSVVMVAKDAQVEQLKGRRRATPLSTPPKRKLAVPFQAPSYALNPLTVRAFNTVYYAANKSTQKLVDWDTFFYPLDSVLHWNRIYGRRGFVQYQALLPKETSRDGLVALLERIARQNQASFLAVLKSCGERGRGWMSYLFPGHTLALDFPNFGPELMPFVAELDKILLDHGGRLYLAKDAMMDPVTFRTMYPEAERFLAYKGEVDPEGRFQSAQARRVGLVNAA
ncbi:MAG: FAD-binding oxidoreductase [Myxococcota bacterium]